MKHLKKNVELLDVIDSEDEDRTPEELEIQESHNGEQLVMQKYSAMTHEYRYEFGIIFY